MSTDGNPARALLSARDIVVRPRFRRAVAAIVVFFAAAAVSVALGGIHATHHVVVDGVRVVEEYRAHQIGSWVAIAVCAIAGVGAVRMLAAEVARIAGLRGSPAASALRLIIQLVGYLTVIVMVLGLLAVSIQSVLLSGAIGSVVIGLAAQQSLSNVIAGIVLLVARPFVVGDYITLRAGAVGGQYDGTVTGISLMFTTVHTDEGPISLPNAAVLNAATGRRQRPA
jgi:small-conductance mechanosensitive channel